MKKVEAVQFPARMPNLKRVAAYARVSTDKDAMHHSLSAQVSYYSSYIQKNPTWKYCGVYADEAKTGTKASRENFQRMLDDAREGNLDMVITKSISRFARNTVMLLETVRELKELGVDVYFEEQNIHTFSLEGELMLSILAGFAEEESLSVSENMKWRIRKNFESGIPWDGTILGYRLKDGKYVIEPKEAKIVRHIFQEYLDGKGAVSIANELNSRGIRTRLGNRWTNSVVMRLLKNPTYTGNLILQKTYRDSHLNKRKMVNTGQYDKFEVTNSHEAIIDQETFDVVQKEFERRQKIYGKSESRPVYPLTGKIECGICGKNYRHKKRGGHFTWICSTYQYQGSHACHSKQIPEETIERMAEEFGGSEMIRKIIANPENELVFILNDGSKHKRYWKDRSRADSWTPEMRQEARERRMANG